MRCRLKDTHSRTPDPYAFRTVATVNRSSGAVGVKAGLAGTVSWWNSFQRVGNRLLPDTLDEHGDDTLGGDEAERFVFIDGGVRVETGAPK